MAEFLAVGELCMASILTYLKCSKLPKWTLSTLEVHHFSGYSKTGYKKLFTRVESRVSAISLLKRGE